MQEIHESAEHHFMTFLEQLKRDPRKWVSMHFEVSRKLPHDVIIENPEQIAGKLAEAGKSGEVFCKELTQMLPANPKGVLYRFTDNDVLYLCPVGSDEEAKALSGVYDEMIGRKMSGPGSYDSVEKNLYFLEKLADSKLLGSKRMSAYRKMSDANVTGSISIRHRRRDNPLIMIIEDDRFTASYAASILNKEYDLIHARTGEDAISLHIDNAPDVIFVDIHLPGINGHQTLGAIRKIDSEVFAIMLSVDTEKTNVVSASSNGAQGFLKKPFSKERLLAAVKKSPAIRKTKSSSGSSQTFFN